MVDLLERDLLDKRMPADHLDLRSVEDLLGGPWSWRGSRPAPGRL